MPDPFEFDRTWRFDVGIERLWAALEKTDDYPSWFPWLEVHGMGRLAAGTTSTFTVRPPLPYRLRLRVTVTDVLPCHEVRGVVDGDLSGPARLVVDGDDASATARLHWSLQVQRTLLVATARVARPLMVWGHDAVVGTGVRRFRRMIEP